MMIEGHWLSSTALRNIRSKPDVKSWTRSQKIEQEEILLLRP